MVGAFRSELLKLRKRPMLWTLAAILAVLVALLGYLLDYIIYLTFVAQGDASVGLRNEMIPMSVGKAPIAFATQGDYAIGVVLGALLVGSDYEWATLKTVLTQRTTRIGTYAGKLLTLAVAVAFLVVVIFATGAVSSLVVGLVAESHNQVASISWPALGDVLRSMGAEWLILSMWASMGMMFAVLFRSPGIGIGLGVGEWILEQLIALQGAKLSAAISAVASYLPGSNYTALSVGTTRPTRSWLLALVDVSMTHAVLVLAVYALAFVVIAGTVLKFRDVL